MKRGIWATLKFPFFLLVYVAIFFTVEFIIFKIFYSGFNIEDIGKLSQFAFWLVGFGMGLFLLFVPYVRKRIFLLVSIAIAIVYLITFFAIPETENNSFIDVMQNFVFVVEFILLPQSIREQIREHSK